MKIVQINTTCGISSTGKICEGISQKLENNSIENYILYSAISNGNKLGIQCSNVTNVRIQAIKSRIFGNYGFNSNRATRKMIDSILQIRPDIVHLHNIHGHDCNLEMLFSFLKIQRIKLIWTFHDCWAFTGYCPHFWMIKCNKWKDQCKDCAQFHEYSLLFDNSLKLFERKKRVLSDLDMTIVTPSRWLSGLVKQSFLGNYPVQVIPNGIDLQTFKPTQSCFRKIHNIENLKIVLGVSFDLGYKKGLDVFIELSKILPKDYKIVLVGTNDAVDFKLPDNIISIHRTNSQKELAEIYSAADVFVNPTREDNYPTVNMESIACGTPVITFDTGGSSEMIDANCGAVVACDDIESLRKAIIFTCENKPYSAEQCCSKASSFDKNKKYQEYVDLYERIITSGNERN